MANDRFPLPNDLSVMIINNHATIIKMLDWVVKLSFVVQFTQVFTRKINKISKDKCCNPILLIGNLKKRTFYNLSGTENTNLL
jgi:uncharacterized membrane protein